MKALIFFIVLTTSTNLIFAQSGYKVTVNSKDYVVREETLDAHFGKCFNKLVTNRIAKQKNFELWSKSYLAWKTSIRNCSMSWRLYGNKPAELKLHDCYNLSAELRGLADDGSEARGNPNDPKNNAKRISYIIGAITQSISDEILRL